MEFVNDCEKIAIENPIGVMSKEYRKPNQIIQPYWFGDKAQKVNLFMAKRITKFNTNRYCRKRRIFSNGLIKMETKKDKQNMT